MSETAQYGEAQYLDEKYAKWVQAEVEAQAFQTTKFAFVSNWDEFTAGNSKSSEGRPDVVLATECGPERLSLVDRQRDLWGGPLAVSVFIPEPKGSGAADSCSAAVLSFVRDAAKRSPRPFAVSLLYANSSLPNVHCNIEPPDRAEPWMDEGKWRERFDGEDALSLWHHDYPTNALRQLSKDMVERPAFLFFCEPDFAMPVGLHDRLLSDEGDAGLELIWSAWRGSRQRKALIVPAYARTDEQPPAKRAQQCAADAASIGKNDRCWMHGTLDMPLTKDYLQEMALVDGTVIMMDGHRDFRRHECYNPVRALSARSLYAMQYALPCEPYFIALSDAMPDFDLRFQGRTTEKLAHLTHMVMLGYEFAVDPTAFVLRLPSRREPPLGGPAAGRPAWRDLVVLPWVLLRVSTAELHNTEGVVARVPMPGSWMPFMQAFSADLEGGSGDAGNSIESQSRDSQAKPEAPGADVEGPSDSRADGGSAPNDSAGASVDGRVAHNKESGWNESRHGDGSKDGGGRDGSSERADGEVEGDGSDADGADAADAAAADVAAGAAADARTRPTFPDPPEPEPVEDEPYWRLQFHNPEYKQWVLDNVVVVPYVTDELFYKRDWEPFLNTSAGPADADTPDAPRIVVLTQTSPERLPFVRRIMRLWRGPIALSVYVPHPHGTAGAAQCRDAVMRYVKASSDESPYPLAVSLLYAVHRVPNSHCNITEASTGLEDGHVDEALWHERFDGRNALALYNEDYPVNPLRQLSKDMVKANVFTFLCDADFVMPKNMHARLRTGRSLEMLSNITARWQDRGERALMLVPAFERLANETAGERGKPCAANSLEVAEDDPCWLYQAYDVPGTKAHLVRMTEEYLTVAPFHEESFAKGHGCYDPRGWLHSDEPYTADYSFMCEPYIIALNAALPDYEERFHGRRLDKVLYLTHVAAWGFEFIVNPDLFITHLPHKPAIGLDALVVNETMRADLEVVPKVLSAIMLEEIATQAEAVRTVQLPSSWRKPLGSEGDEAVEAPRETEGPQDADDREAAGAGDAEALRERRGSGRQEGGEELQTERRRSRRRTRRAMDAAATRRSRRRAVRETQALPAYPDPPSVPARGNIPYNKLQFHNPAYKEWVRENIRAVEYEIDRMAFVREWNQVLDEQRSDPAADPVIVLLSQTSPERLPFVRRMMRLWQGPISLAVYVPHPKSTDAARQCRDTVLRYIQGGDPQAHYPLAVSLLYANFPVPNSHCNISETSTGLEDAYMNEALWHERFDGKNVLALWHEDYPVNNLRQLSKDMVKANVFTFLCDADFVMPSNLYGRLRQGTSRQMLQRMARVWQEGEERVAMIIPGYERLAKVPAGPDARRCAPSSLEIKSDSVCWMYQQYDVPETKDQLRIMTERDGTATPFHEQNFRNGHACYQPRKWLESDKPYYGTYRIPCEPYIVALNAALPDYETRFHGRQLDKVMYLTHVAAWGTRFLVNPDVFIMHLPHKPAFPLDTQFVGHPTYQDSSLIPWVLMQIKLDEVRDEAQFKTAVHLPRRWNEPLTESGWAADALGVDGGDTVAAFYPGIWMVALLLMFIAATYHFRVRQLL